MRNHRLTRSAALGLALVAVAAPTTSAQIHEETVVGPQESTPSAAQIRDETVLRAPQTSPSPSSAPSDGGIDWGDAAIGAGGLLALIALGLGSAFAVVHHRRARPQPMRKLTVSGPGGR